MPRTAKKAARKTTGKNRKVSRASHEMIDTKTVDLIDSPVLYPETASSGSSKRWVVAVVVIILALGAYLGSKGYIVAALVDGKPLFRWHVGEVMASRYGQQTLESMISEQLIANAAKKQGVVLSQADVDTKIQTVVKSLGPNVKLEELLKYQGMTKADFEHQIRLQLTVEKILGKDVTVSDSDIETFITANKETMVATEEASLRGEAREALMQQKINEKIQPWFAQLKEKAKIVRLMK